jgi:Rap1a immunity proteins
MIARCLLASAAIFVVALASTSAKCDASKTESVQALYDECNGQLEDKLYCLGYISGVFGQMSYNRYLSYGLNDDRDAAKIIKLFSVCSLTAVSDAAMVQAFINWAKKHRQSWDLDEQLGVMYALRESWPCSP